MIDKNPSKKIETVEDLAAERVRLERSIIIHKAMLTREMENVRTEVNTRIQPAMNVVQSAQEILKTLRSPIVIASAVGIAILLATNSRRKAAPSTSILPIASQLLLSLINKRSGNRKML